MEKTTNLDEMDYLMALIDEMIRLASADAGLRNTESILRIARQCACAEKDWSGSPDRLN